MTTKIQWADDVLNCVVGCSPVLNSPGCDNCYAKAAANTARLQQFPQYQAVKAWNGTTRYEPKQLEKAYSKGKPTRYFVCSMSDLFHHNNPDAWIDSVFVMAALNPRHTFQILTKRPERLIEYVRGSKERVRVLVVDEGHKRIKQVPYSVWQHWESREFVWPPQNIWAGASVENQAQAEKRIPLLVNSKLGFKVHFLSCEPLLEQVNLYKLILIECPVCKGNGSLRVQLPGEPEGGMACHHCNASGRISGIDQIIIGGESGPKSRPCHLDWIRSLVRQCLDASVAPFVKQLGAIAVDGHTTQHYVELGDRKGGSMEEWPLELRIREFPKERI